MKARRGAILDEIVSGATYSSEAFFDARKAFGVWRDGDLRCLNGCQAAIKT